MTKNSELPCSLCLVTVTFWSSFSEKLVRLCLNAKETSLDAKTKREAQAHCNIFRQWSAKKIDRTDNESLLQRNPVSTKISTETFLEEIEPVSSNILKVDKIGLLIEPYHYFGQ